MSNPNNCSTCEWKKTPQGGWCYMFRDEPNEVCMQHTNTGFTQALNDQYQEISEWIDGGEG